MNNAYYWKYVYIFSFSLQSVPRIECKKWKKQECNHVYTHERYHKYIG